MNINEKYFDKFSWDLCVSTSCDSKKTLIVICHDQCETRRQMTDTLNLSLQTEVSVTVNEIKGHGFDIILIDEIRQMYILNY